jgi:hypothetical protein
MLQHPSCLGNHKLAEEASIPEQIKWLERKYTKGYD